MDGFPFVNNSLIATSPSFDLYMNKMGLKLPRTVPEILSEYEEAALLAAENLGGRATDTTEAITNTTSNGRTESGEGVQDMETPSKRILNQLRRQDKAKQRKAKRRWSAVKHTEALSPKIVEHYTILRVRANA